MNNNEKIENIPVKKQGDNTENMDTKTVNISSDLKKSFLEKMFTIRRLEEKVKELFSLGLIRGSTHVYIGEEAVAVGACSALLKDDNIVSTHRGHGHCIAKGAELKPMIAELLGKETGYCKGKGGSMHIADLDKGILGAVGIVGSGLPIAVGSALSSKYLNNKKVTISFFGDGASNQGTFHECLNLASIWKLPIIFICENNSYAITVPACYSTACANIADRAAGYNMPGIIVDGNDVEKMYFAVKEASDNARNGKGPVLIEAKTYRLEGHWIGDPQVYRDKIEVDLWKKKDPVNTYKNKLINEGIITEKDYLNIVDKVNNLMDEAVEFAKNSEFLSIDKVMDDIYT